MGRTQIPIALWSGQPPATFLQLVSGSTSRAFHTYLLPSPQTSPGLGSWCGEKEKGSTIFHCVATDFTGYSISFKIIGYMSVLSMYLGSENLQNCKLL